jgi:methionine-gamma-lyase
MQKHSRNAMYVAQHLEKLGIRVFYPGLKSHPQHNLIRKMLIPGFGFGGMLVFDAKDEETANRLMIMMQEEKVGYLAVSLGFFKTLFSSPGQSTSSEIPKEEQLEMGMSSGLVRCSIGLDNDIERSFASMKRCLERVGLIEHYKKLVI